MSLRWKLIIAFVSLALLPTAIIGFYADYVARGLINHAAQTDLAKASNRTALQLDSYILAQLNGIRTEAQQPSLAEYLEVPPDLRPGSVQEINARQILAIFSRKDPTFINSYALLDKRGINLLDTEERQVGNNESGFEYFTTAFSRGLPFASSVLFQEDNDFYISAPVRNEKGEVIGVLRAEYDALMLQSMLLSILPEKGTGNFISIVDMHTYIRLADTGGTNNLYKSLKDLSPVEISTLQTQQLLPPGTRANLTQPAPQFVAGIDNLSQSQFFEAYSDSIKDDALITGTRLKYVPWMVIEGRSQKILSRPILDQRRATILMALLILIAAVLVAVLMSLVIARPVVNLTSIARRITGGDLDAVAPALSDDEVGALAQAFNSMTEKLRQTLAGLQSELGDRKQAEQALRESEERFRKVFNSSPIAICITTLETWKLLDANYAYWDLTGYDAETSIGKNAEELKLWDEPGERDTFVKNLRQKKSLYNPDDYFYHTNGMIRHVISFYELIRLGDDECVLAMFYDMSGQKRTLDALQIAHKESETLRESLASIVTTFELKEVVERILDQIKRVIPYDTASVWRVDGEWQTLVVSRDLPRQVSPADLKFPINNENSSAPILMGEKPYVLSHNVQEELTDFRGPHSYINSWLAVPLKVHGKVTGVIALDGVQKNQFNIHHAELLVTFANQVAIALENARLFADLQDQLRKQIALRSASMVISSSLHLDQVLGEICTQICIINDGTSAYIAQYNRDYTSYALVAEYIGVNANTKEKVSDLGVTYYKQEGAWLFDENSNSEYMILHSDDADLTPWAERTMVEYGGKSILYLPLYVQGRLLGHTELWDSRSNREFTREEILFCRTLAQQAAIAIANASLFEQLQNELAGKKELIGELESKNAELERFTYTVSHDLKSPLFTIRGFLGFLEQDAMSGNQQRLQSDMQRITDATEKMQNLLNDLLELSRIGRLKNESASIRFDELVRDAVSLVQGRIMERGIAVHIDANLPAVYGDQPRLMEVIQNLVDNAAKFMGDQKEPRIEIGQSGEEDGKLVFYVRDNGVGVASEHHDRIFGLFNKLDVKSDGTGIGLALVKRIIEVHGGRIWVESEAGLGSTFYFSLPRG